MAKAPTTIVEKTCIGIGLALLIGLGVYFYTYTAERYDLDPKPAYYSKFPVNGEHIDIDSVDTGFVEKEGAETLLPSATIRLNPSSNKNGALRVFFRSNVGESVYESKVVGDSDTLEIKDGKFSNGTNEMTIQCTKGLDGLPDFFGYKSQDSSRWVLEIREGASGSRATDFKDLTQAAIEPVILGE